jgi:hypothetical protein
MRVFVLNRVHTLNAFLSIRFKKSTNRGALYNLQFSKLQSKKYISKTAGKYCFDGQLVHHHGTSS